MRVPGAFRIHGFNFGVSDSGLRLFSPEVTEWKIGYLGRASRFLHFQRPSGVEA